MIPKILLIDDDPLVLRSFKNLLSRAGYEVISALSYKEALKAFEEKEFDLVLSDIRMPGKNGVEVVSEIQSRLADVGKKNLPIIFVTGYADFSDQLNATFIGEVLTKPVDNDKLLMTIRDYL
jgi:CheY-like chemotaxis protein